MAVVSGRFLTINLHAHVVGEIDTAKQAGRKQVALVKTYPGIQAKDGVIRFALKPEFNDLRLDENGQ
jgi:hypothetical protein